MRLWRIFRGFVWGLEVGDVVVVVVGVGWMEVVVWVEKC